MADIIPFPLHRRRAQIAQDARAASAERVRRLTAGEAPTLEFSNVTCSFGPVEIVTSGGSQVFPGDGSDPEYVQGPYWFGVRIRPDEPDSA